MVEEERLLYCHTLQTEDGEEKTVRVYQGDLCRTRQSYDILVCSAFKGNYYPLANTLIGALNAEKGISVGALAQVPELDLKTMGCWLSEQIPGNFRRVACVELLDLRRWQQQRDSAISEMALKSTFSTLKYLLEQAAIRGLSVERVALPILGTGNQGIELCYVVTPLISQCTAALRTIPGLKEIDFYERNDGKASYLADRMNSYFARRNEAVPKLFISYSSAQQEEANTYRERMGKRGLSCWMAPESIPTGSSYQEEIPLTLSRIPAVLLLLTPQAEASRWVQKEVGTAIGADRILIPCQLWEYSIGQKFQFLLDGEQMFRAWQFPKEEVYDCLANTIRNKIG